jgi:hypothetical protein
MNTTDVDDDYDEYNVEALERAAEDLRDHNAAGLDSSRSRAISLAPTGSWRPATPT